MEVGTFRRGRLEYRPRFRVALILIGVAWLIMLARLFQLQVLQHDRYAMLSEVSSIGRERIFARRGEILDRNGRPLARNVDTHRLTLVPHYLADADRELEEVRTLLELDDEAFAKLRAKVTEFLADKEKRFRTITVSPWLTSDFCPRDGSPLTFLPESTVRWSPSSDREYVPLDVDKVRFCPVDHQRLKYSLNKRVARCPACERTFILPEQTTDPVDNSPLVEARRNETCPVCNRDYFNQYAALNARLHDLPGFDIRTSLRRFYPFREEVSHLVGFLNEATKDEIAGAPDTYRLGDLVGRTGLEHAFETELRGRHGEEMFIKDAKGFRRDPNKIQTYYTGVRSTPPEDGKTVNLTVDIRIQTVLADAMRKVDSGAAVVLDPQTGDVLALYSKPSFDPNLSLPTPSVRRSEAAAEKLAAERTAIERFSPQMNKATTAYAPGSVFKIVPALAGLMEGTVDERTAFTCHGFYMYKRRKFRCHALGGHGKMDLVESLIHSCDVYYYNLGEQLGLDTLALYGRDMYGFGEKVGLEIPEQAGRLPTEKWYRENDPRGYLPGFALSAAVGQGSVLATPLQVARAFSVLVNGGDVLQLHLVRSVSDDAGHEVSSTGRELVRHVRFPDEYGDVIRQGLHGVVNDEVGTAAGIAVAELPIAGKTGTAESKELRPGVDDPDFKAWLQVPHAWFVGYAPADAPRVLIVVFVEHGGGGGKHAAPIAQQALLRIFERRLGNLGDAP